MALPIAPSAVSVTHIGQQNDLHAFRVTWTRTSVLPAEVYHIEEETAPAVWTLRHTTPESAEEAIVVAAGLGSPNTTREFRIRAVNIDGNSANVTFSAKNGATPGSSADIEDPTDVAVDNLVEDGFRITWEYDLTTNGYRNHEGFEIKIESLVSGVIVTLRVAFWEDQATVHNLQPGTEYFVSMAAYHDRADGLLSSFAPVGPLTVTTAAGDPPILAAESLTLQVGATCAGTVRFQGEGEVIAWSLSGEPAGLELTIREDSVQNRVADFSGAPSEAGMFAALITARIRETSTGDESMISTEMDILVGSTTFLSWFHSDPERIDLQIDLRTGIVTSEVLGATMEWLRGEARRVHLIFRDGTRYSAVTLEYAALIVKLPGQLDSAPLLEVVDDPPATETIAGRTLPYLDVDASGAFLTQIFDVLNRATRDDSASATLPAQAQLLWRKTGGTDRTSAPFDITFRQDNSR